MGWIRLYNLTFIVGLAMSFIIFWGLNYLFPPIGLGEEAPFVENDVLFGVEDRSSESADEKNAAVANGGDVKNGAVATVAV